MQTTINGQAVEAIIIAADGTEVMEALQPAERDLLAKIDAVLQANPRFRRAYPGARLTRIDSNRGLDKRDEGRFYLRYQHKKGMAEFWGNASDVEGVDIGKGIVGVVV
jgi:hypothetical protein